ncbi:MAG: histidinol-phosphate transaminase [Halobacteriota archaeon]
MPSTYVPGRSAEEVARVYGIDPEAIVKLGSNENALGPSPEAVEAIKKHIQDISIYPAPGYIDLKDAIARYVGVAAEHVIVGNGSDDLLNTLLRYLIERNGEAIIPIPTYSYYETIVEAAHGTCVFVDRRPDFSVDVEQIVAAITKKTKLIFVCSPNNPTGNSIDRAALEHLLQSTNALVVLDEAYVEFASESLVELTNHFDNLLVSRTFSKAFGLAGLRLGYAVLNEDLARSYNRLMLAFSVNQLAVKAGVAVLSNLDFLHETVAMVEQGRTYLREHLPLKTYPSDANFIFADVAPHTSYEVTEYLVRQGIIIRNCETFRGCSHSQIRITVGKPWQNAKVLEELDTFVKTRR